MSDTVAASLLTVAGMTITAVTAAFIQLRITKSVIDAERAKSAKEIAAANQQMMDQVRAETKARHNERRIERVLELASELIGLVDPEVFEAKNYPSIVTTTVHLQMLLNLDDKLEAQLNGAATKVAGAVRHKANSDLMYKLQDIFIQSVQAMLHRGD